MSLEFNRLVEQVYRMGAMLEQINQDHRDVLALAQARFAAASDLKEVWRRIEWVRGSDISGYRGAAPPAIYNAEPINATYDAPALPPSATLIAGDGSQIYPDADSPAHYYLLNVGLYTYRYGIDETPQALSLPTLFFHPAHVHDKYGKLISARAVDDRRTVAEMRALADAAWELRGGSDPLLTLYDNRLMFLPSNDAQDSDELMANFLAALTKLQDSGAILAGYIDKPRSKRFIQLLYLLSMEDEGQLKANQHLLSRAGDLEVLSDEWFFDVMLRPGQRSAIMVQNSPQNKAFRDHGEDYEIAFFYLKVTNMHAQRVVRVDLPLWVARQPAQVDALHALLLDQCRLQGRNPYPYALTRADELAWVSHKDKAKLEELINAQVRRIQQALAQRTLAAKAQGKLLARSEQRIFSMRGEEMIDER